VLKEHGETAQVEGRMVTFAEREEAVNAAYWRDLEQQYLHIERSGAVPEPGR
jgi:hypothetical protein